MEVGQSYFIWNGVDCRSMGIRTNGPAPIIRPEERVKHITIPGVSGDLTEIEGNDIYNSYIQTVTIHVKAGMHVRDVYSWLRGSGYVTFSGEPDRKQSARIVGAITLNRHSRNLDWWSGEVQFYCQPLKELLIEDPVTVALGGSIRNFGDVASRPLYKITSTAETLDFAVLGNGYSWENRMFIAGLTSGDVVWVDTASMEVWNADKTALLTKNTMGDFPMLPAGLSLIPGNGWSTVEIVKRERYL